MFYVLSYKDGTLNFNMLCYNSKEVDRALNEWAMTEVAGKRTVTVHKYDGKLFESQINEFWDNRYDDDKDIERVVSLNEIKNKIFNESIY